MAKHKRLTMAEWFEMTRLAARVIVVSYPSVNDAKLGFFNARTPTYESYDTIENELLNLAGAKEIEGIAFGGWAVTFDESVSHLSDNELRAECAKVMVKHWRDRID